MLISILLLCIVTFVFADDVGNSEPLSSEVVISEESDTSEEPVVVEEPIVEEPVVEEPLSSLFTMVVPFTYNRFTIGGGTNNGRVFEADIITAPFSFSYEGALNFNYQIVSQRLRDLFAFTTVGTIGADDTGVTPMIFLNIGYKNYLANLGTVPIFVKGLFVLNLTNTFFPYSGGGLRFTLSATPQVGFGIGRMYDITSVLYAKLYLEALGIEVRTSKVKAAVEVMGKEAEFTNKLRSNNGLNHIAYYSALMKALDLEGRYLEFDAIPLSQLFIFEQNKFDFSRLFGLTHGWEVEITAQPEMTYAQDTTPSPVFTFNSLNVELIGTYASLIFDQRLYWKVETDHTLLYIPGGSPELLYVGKVIGEVRYFPHQSKWWVGSSGEVAFNSETTQFNIVFDADVHYLITPNFEVYLGGNNYTFGSDYNVYVGANLRLL
jgi:hypothetical protein